jgi:hypothetical protein
VDLTGENDRTLAKIAQGGFQNLYTKIIRTMKSKKLDWRGM